MPKKSSVTVRNAMLDAIETAIGPSPILKLRSGAPPASCAAADTGTVIATINLGSDFMGNASNGSKSFSGTPLQDLSADNGGTIGHYRLYAADGTTCHDQGSADIAGNNPDMVVDNPVVNQGQQINVTSWTIGTAALA